MNRCYPICQECRMPIKGKRKKILDTDFHPNCAKKAFAKALKKKG